MLFSKKFLFVLCCVLFIKAQAQKVEFTEYDLPNGLHVILHEDHSAPVVAVSVFYHVGSKNEDTNRTGFAHFFEHLLFEGSENIKRGEFSKIVSSNGGQDNATTSQDRTFYYENFPSNDLEIGLWLESERMMHPVINDIGVKTQNEVVKEEKRQRLDNQPYGHLVEEVFKRLFTQHPYRWQPIGSMARFQQAMEWHNPVLFLKHILAALFLFPAHREAGTSRKPYAHWVAAVLSKHDRRSLLIFSIYCQV